MRWILEESIEWRLARFIYKRSLFAGKYLWVKDKHPELILTLPIIQITSKPKPLKRKEYETNLYRGSWRGHVLIKETLYVEQKHVELLNVIEQNVPLISLSKWMRRRKGLLHLEKFVL